MWLKEQSLPSNLENKISSVETSITNALQAGR